jgi:hypothetical protein
VPSGVAESDREILAGVDQAARDRRSGFGRCRTLEESMNPDEIEYVTCANCDTPCYVFEINAQGKVAVGFCAECGNDEPTEFTIPGETEKE